MWIGVSTRPIKKGLHANIEYVTLSHSCRLRGFTVCGRKHLHSDSIAQHVCKRGVEWRAHRAIQSLELTAGHAIEALQAIVAQQCQRDEDDHRRVGDRDDGE